MSSYYVIGSNKELKNLEKLNVGFEYIKNVDLCKYIKQVNFDKNFYYVSNFLASNMSYAKELIHSDKYVSNYDNSQTDIENFIEYLLCENITLPVDFYKFWSIFDNNSDEEINQIYCEEEIDINSSIIPTKDFDFQTRYIFKKQD